MPLGVSVEEKRKTC